MGIQKKFVQRIIASCFAFVIGISTLVAIIMNVNKSTASGGDTENPSENLPIISAGVEHSLAIIEGQLYAWGNNQFGQLGDGTTTQRKLPVKIGDEANWVSVVAGAYHSLALNSSGEIYTWGMNGTGQLGDGEMVEYRPIPTKIGNKNNWVSISAGYTHSLAINSLGELYAWGSNNMGQLGDGTSGTSINDNSADKNTPVKIGNEKWVSVSGGGCYTLAINESGELYAWGYNDLGQLGNGTDGDGTNKKTPVKIGFESNWIKVSAGSSHSLAINSLGELYAWGYNNYGQLGDETTVGKNTPVKIGIQSNWVDISAGGRHSLAINSLGELYSWGSNSAGQIGDGTMVNQRIIPTRIGTETNWVNISAGEDHSLAINTLGRPYSWGWDMYGQLGLGGVIGSYRPVEIIIVGCDVAIPNFVAGCIISSPSEKRVHAGGSYTFTITTYAGYSLRVVRLNTTNGSLALRGTAGNVYTFIVRNVVGDIVATDFIVSVFRIE